MPLFMGLDCGGSSTRVRVEDESGSVVFEGLGGPGNFATTPAEDFRANLQAALRHAPRVDAVVGGFAGLIGDDARQAARGLLVDLTVSQMADAVADYSVAFASATDFDVLVVSGTGSVVVYSSPAGVIKSGGMGPWLGDEGSAYRIGQAAVWQYCTHPETDLTANAFREALMEVFGTDCAELLPLKVNAAPSPAASLARLAPSIARDAEHSVFMRRSVVSALTPLVSLATHATVRCGKILDARVGLAGGLWDAGSIFQETFVEVLNKLTVEHDLIEGKSRQYHVERMTTPPVQGAVKLAKRLFYGH